MQTTREFTFDAATGEPVQPVKIIPNSDELRNLQMQRDDANERANRLAEFLRHKGLQGEYYDWLKAQIASAVTTHNE